MSASNYLENKVLDHVLKNTAFTQPTNLYMALFTADPTDTGATTNEVVGGSYARQPITFAAASGGSAASSAAVTFSGMPAATVNFFMIMDAVTSGNSLFIGPLTTPQTLTAGQALTFNAGQVTVGAD